MIYIVVMVVMVILLVALYLIAKVHMKEKRLRREEDFIDVFLRKKKREIMANAAPISLAWYLRLMLICPIAGGLIVYFVTGNGLLAVIVAVLALFIPKGILLIAKNTQGRNFEKYYAESLEQLSVSLRAGMSLFEAVGDVSECQFLHTSMKKRYATLYAKLKMGIPTAEAFREFAEECNSQDAMDVAIVIDIQSEVGGREAEAVQEIATNIRRRIAMRREIKTVLAGTSIMVYIMDFIIPGAMLLFLILNQNYLDLYLSSITMFLIFLFLAAIPFVGAYVNHKLLNRVKRGNKK